MDLAFALSARSTCSRLKVGCVIASTDYRRILSVGYNGGPSGGTNECLCGPEKSQSCMHSEENACISCTSPRYEEKIVYVTHLPCPQCALRLIQLGGVVQVRYVHPYRLSDSIQMLEQAGIEVICDGAQIHIDGSIDVKVET